MFYIRETTVSNLGLELDTYSLKKNKLHKTESIL